MREKRSHGERGDDGLDKKRLRGASRSEYCEEEKKEEERGVTEMAGLCVCRNMFRE